MNIEYLTNFSSVYEALEWAKKQMPQKPTKVKKPFLSSTHTAEELEKYNADFEKYEKDKAKFDEDLIIYKSKLIAYNDILEQYIKNQTGFDHVPEKNREKVWAAAWSDGHAHGWYEVYHCLNRLVDIYV